MEVGEVVIQPQSQQKERAGVMDRSTKHWTSTQETGSCIQLAVNIGFF